MESKIKKIAKIDITIEENEHICTFSLPVGMPLSYAYDASLKCTQEIINLMNENLKKQQAQREELKEEKKEESTQE